LTNEAHQVVGARHGEAALKRAGLQIRFHDLRRTCITKLAESKASEHTLMAIAGHVSRKMIEHYSHIHMEAKRGSRRYRQRTVVMGSS
jgi:integrase